ncbi:MAG: S-methyl-5-thioribose-1-phosphate isomerase [candidate division Zixibacteria bacterium]|nr:S-methyl-5-thioribose-1-phosphate isomerase [candidate division Zixibacteria bacterium]
MKFKTLEWKNNTLVILDQTLLPGQVKYFACTDYSQVVTAIKSLQIRGAPAIGIAAAYGVVLGIQDLNSSDSMELSRRLAQVSSELAATRPTAVNLFWALERMNRVAKAIPPETGAGGVAQRLLQEAHQIHTEDREMCLKIGENGSGLLGETSRILTHCNAGALATGGIGTALGIIYTAHRQGKKISVFADETRPVLQGARLTAWELMQEGVDCTLICDTVPGTLLKDRKVDCVIVGGDRIAKNHDVANKIGTYQLAVLAKEHGVPFYVAAPSSSFDPKLESGSQIEIEERSSSEVTGWMNQKTAPPDVKVYSPAFDVTPAKYISAIVTDKGIIRPNRK